MVETVDVEDGRTLSSYNLPENWERISSYVNESGIFITLMNKDFINLYLLNYPWDPLRLLNSYPSPETKILDIEMENPNEVLACTEEGIQRIHLAENELKIKFEIPIVCRSLFITGENLYIESEEGWLKYSDGLTSSLPSSLPNFPDALSDRIIGIRGGKVISEPIEP